MYLWTDAYQTTSIICVICVICSDASLRFNLCGLTGVPYPCHDISYDMIYMERVSVTSLIFFLPGTANGIFSSTAVDDTVVGIGYLREHPFFNVLLRAQGDEFKSCT